MPRTTFRRSRSRYTAIVRSGSLDTSPAPRRDIRTALRIGLLNGPEAAVAAIAVLSALGVLVIAIAYVGARENRSWADFALWDGMIIIMLPIAFRLIGAAATRGERLGLVIVLGLALYSVRVLLSPGQFVMHDELGAYRTIADILRTGRLYTPPNPVDAAYSAYPGLGSATAALSRLSGVGIVPCGLTLVGIAKALTTGGLFLFIERCTRSPRAAGIAVVLYAANPEFVYFDAQVAYESLALGLGALALWTMLRAAEESGGWGDCILAAGLDGAVVLTHHLTSYALTLIFCAWAVALGFRGGRAAVPRRIMALAAFSLAITVTYLLTHLRATESDIGGSITGSLKGLFNVITGSTGGKAPFTSAAGYSNSALEQIVGLASVALLIAAWPFALFASWRERARGPGVVILGLVCLLYPASLGLRLTAAGSETSDRTSEFVFVGLGCALALAFIILLARRIDNGGRRGRMLSILALVGIGIVFAGGITVGTPPEDMLPGPYLVAADSTLR